MDLLVQLVILALLYAWPVLLSMGFSLAIDRANKSRLFVVKSIGFGYLIFLIGMVAAFILEVWKEGFFIRCSSGNATGSCSQGFLEFMDFLDDYGFWVVTIILMISHYFVVSKVLVTRKTG
ncbi:hypothetical protein [Marinobacter mangrovi]|uniref:hypothetical protein n=1 Tax=Marinobacter mangrovi TaxID=2803918 RepID=UPI001932BDAD|nr:hypothetical protein [Marinobacter mangrovi]